MLSCGKTFLVLTFIEIIVCSENGFKIHEGTVGNILECIDNGPGEPLFLTPLIEAGKLEEARKLAAVKPFLSDIESYAGYLTIDKDYNSNMFFWFFKNTYDWESAPVTIWLNGGPGTTSLFGLFLENGPYIIRNGTLYQRYHSWHLDSNIIFMDNPVGSGFSFTDSDEGYVKNQTTLGELLYSALKQFFMLFPNLIKNKFFISGESYAGKYAPALGYTIHKYNSLPDNNFKINLQGLTIGNGFTDPFNMLHYGNFLYEIGLIDFNELDVFHDYEDKIREHIVNEQWDQASLLFAKMMRGGFLYPQGSYFKNTTGLELYNFVVDKGTWPSGLSEFINSTSFRKTIHVGSKPFHGRSLVVAKHLREDGMQSVIPWVVELLDHYRIVFYNGQLDVICAYPLTENFLKNMKWKYSVEYSEAKRQKWKVGNKIAGYFKSVGNLTEVLVRNAGHLVPTDQPLWSRVLFKKFITNCSLAECDYIAESLLSETNGADVVTENSSFG